MKKLVLLGLLLLISAGAVSAEIEKEARFENGKMMFYWWPKLQIPEGWVHDTDGSFKISANLLHPKGTTLDNAPYIIFAKAFYDKDPKSRGTFESFYKADMDDMRKHVVDLQTTEVDPGLRDAKGESLKTFDAHYNENCYDEFCYRDEGDYRLAFTFSANSREGFDKGVSVFRK